MKISLLGNKIGMTQIFDNLGNVIPVTILKVGPCIITQIKNNDDNTTISVQMGYKPISTKCLSKPELGHFQKTNIQPLKYLKEFKLTTEQETLSIGQILKVNCFKVGELVNIQGKNLGKGFSSLQKRHNFTRGPMTHGSKNHRAPGSIGMGTTPGRVFPGKKMAGQLGNKLTTIQNLKVLLIDEKENILVLKGSVPGKARTLLSINSST